MYSQLAERRQPNSRENRHLSYMLCGTCALCVLRVYCVYSVCTVCVLCVGCAVCLLCVCCVCCVCDVQIQGGKRGGEGEGVDSAQEKQEPHT